MLGDSACGGTRHDGSRCRSTVVLASGYCAAHDPDRQAEMAVARAKGGRGKARTARIERLVPSTLKPVLATLLETLGQLHSGELDPKTGSAMAAVAGAIVKVYQAGTLEERLQALEQAYADERRAG